MQQAACKEKKMYILPQQAKGHVLFLANLKNIMLFSETDEVSVSLLSFVHDLQPDLQVLKPYIKLTV